MTSVPVSVCQQWLREKGQKGKEPGKGLESTTSDFLQKKSDRQSRFATHTVKLVTQKGKKISSL